MRGLEGERRAIRRLAAKEASTNPFFAKVFATEADMSWLELEIINLPVDSRYMRPLASTGDDLYFMFGVSAFGGDDPFNGSF